ncbi:hypothetical protein N5E89_16780 [Comamonas aquatica]|jgi:hypothetical protein|uniref:Uncharacterized protein n=3 Tax=Comamonas aquatica TaxID=225991 RepID=A0AA42HRL8_9BURK|nr:hypothetical protein [Comamonas aquatica]MDH0363059.1 hypothetical protein [Comamonas aquatica]MDH0899851.1 hypothetical protein [Comamonas aquatica]MDH1379456.1 hypothetical protein [Comamonas aquatica]MDH1429906.1 hypothetical protein [Comamonas aquatica]MDH1639458.1 hypothetical protein [Comamonas aquatica]
MKYRRPLWVESSLSNFLALLAKAPARASVAPHLGGVLHISGGCLNATTQERSEFRRTSTLQASSFLSPVSFDEAKETGSPPRDKRPLQTNTPQTPNQEAQQKHSYQHLPDKR